MRILVIDGVPHVRWAGWGDATLGSEYTDETGMGKPIWRPLDEPPFEKHPEDREAREAFENLRAEDHEQNWVCVRNGVDGLYELVEIEHFPGCAVIVHEDECCDCEPVKTLRRVDDE